MFVNKSVVKSPVSVLFPISDRNLFTSTSFSKFWPLGLPYFTYNDGARS